MIADTFDIDAAIITLLQSDAQLTALMPDGVWFGDARSGATRFVMVSQIDHEDEAEFQDVAWELVIYQVKAVHQSTSPVDVKAAAKRFQALLLTPHAIAPLNYALMTVRRRTRVRYTERDPANADLRWQHGGAQYEVWVQPTA